MNKSANITPKNAISFKKVFGFFLALIVAAMFITACGGSEEAEEAETTDTEESGDAMEFSPEQIEALLGKFDFDTTSRYFTHKHWGKNLVKRATLVATVSETGYFVLSSNYYGGTKLDHDHVIVTVGEEEITTDAVDLKSNDHQVQEAAGKFYEVNNYSQYRDKGIFDKIGQNPKAPVKIKFKAAKAHADANLPDADKEAILDCYKVSLLARARALPVMN